MTQQPDIVFMVLDTQRADRLSCYGHELETTPHIDAFAADSTLFKRAISAAQWTIPSHSSMFTGLYPSAHTTVQSFSRLPPTLPTIAERLSDGGYYTAAFCNNPLVGVVNNGLRRGFQSFLNYSGVMTSRPNQAGMNPTLLDRYRQQFKRVMALVFGRIQDSFARSELLLDFAFTPFMVTLWQRALGFKGNTAQSLHDASRLLLERKQVGEDQPVFCFINLMGTHLPYHPPRHAIERCAPDVIRNKQLQRYLQRFNSDIYGWLAPLAGEIDDERKAAIDGMYNAEVFAQDEHVGKFLDQLREKGTLDNTILIIAADHGEHMGEKQLVGHLFSVYNELVHVPLIIHDPTGNMPAGTEVDQVVSTRRLFHTILTAADLANEAEERYSLAQSAASDPDGGIVFSEGVPPQNVVNLLQRRLPHLVRDRNCDQTRRAVLDGELKLIKTGDDTNLELYRITDDPNERRNIHDMAPERVQALCDHLLTFVSDASTAAPAAENIEEDTDPELRRRLHDLGYIE